MELGVWQSLICVRKVEFGVYLAKRQDAPREERVLLPAKQVPEHLEVGDGIDVFIYRGFGRPADRNREHAAH